MRPERCWPLAVRVVWWTGAPRRRCGRVGEPGLSHRRVVPGCLVRSGRWSARTHPLLGAGSCRPTPDRHAESTSADRGRRAVVHGHRRRSVFAGVPVSSVSAVRHSLTSCGSGSS